MADFTTPKEVEGYIGLLQLNRDVNVAFRKFISTTGYRIVAGPTWPKPASIASGQWLHADHQQACFPDSARTQHPELWT